MLSLRYDPERRTAIMSVPADSQTWQRIARSIREQSTFASAIGALQIELPWWEFLRCRDAMGHHLRAAGWVLDADDTTRRELGQARERDRQYESAKVSSPLDESAVKARLAVSGFTRNLTAEQMRNVRKLASMPAAATFSVPGAGKTSEALAFFTLRKTPDERLLVVAPKNAFPAWEEQWGLCFNSSSERFVRLVGGYENIARTLQTRAPRLALITYDQLVTVRDLVGGYLSQQPTTLFLDESHRMKRGTAGSRGRAILSLTHLASNKLILSGTPMPNSTEDLVPQFDFLYPQVRTTGDDVAQVIQPIYVRTTKKELGLPPLRVNRIDIPQAPSERKLYEALRSETARSLLVLRAQDRMLLRSAGRSAMRMLQAASNPALLTADSGLPEELLKPVMEEGSGTKVEYVCRRARELAHQGRKVVIWSSFIKNVELISGRLRDIGADFVHGGVMAGSEEDDDTREAKINAFHNEADRQVLVANPAACGEGISLHTVCHDAIYLDRTYNAAQYLQSMDRIHRLGLKPDIITRVEVVCAPGTVDESVHRRLEAKIQRMGAVLNDPHLNPGDADTGDPDDALDLNMTLADMQDFLAELKRES